MASSDRLQLRGPRQLIWLGRSLWRRPTITVARLTLESYLRSRWIMAEVFVVIGLLAAFFFPYYGDMAYFYGSAGEGLGALAILGTGMLVRHSVSARTYIVLARLPSRGSYSRGVMLAAAMLRVPLFLLLLLLVLILHKILHPTVSGLLVGAVGLLANCVLLSVASAALCPPTATRWRRIAALAWLAAALYAFGDITQLPGTVLTIVSAVLSAAGVPLLPFTVCFAFSTRGTIGWPDAVALLMEALYVMAIARVAAAWLEHRELLLH